MIERIRPQISPDQARTILSAPPGFLKKKRHLDKIELFLLPSFIVDVQVTSANTTKRQSFCIDAVLGSFAFFEAATVTSSLITDFRTCPFFLNENDVRDKAVDDYRRYLLRTSLKMRFTFRIDNIVEVRKMYYPFWIGYFKRKGKIDFDVIDALGGEHQGAAMRPVFIKALLNEIELPAD